jgi:hypothetical protein
MFVFMTLLKATKVLVAASLFHHSGGNSGYLHEKHHFYDDPVPGDSFPPNLFYSDDYGAGGNHVGTYGGF